MKISTKEKGKGALALFFLHPFAAFLLALNNLKSRSSFIVIFLFFILFGYTFIAQNEAADSFRYIEKFNIYKNLGFTQYIYDIKEFFSFESNIKDIYEISTYYFVSRFTGNYHFLMALWAVVFSFFYLKSFRFFVLRPEFKKSLFVSLLAFLFLYSNNIFNINGVRFWTAAWVAVYVIFEIVVNKNYRFIALSLITPLIHISYLFFVAVLIIFLLTRRYEKLWVILFFVSFFVAEISVELVQNYQQYLPQALQNMIWSYTISENMEERQNIIENAPLYARILNSLPRYFYNVLMFVFIYNKKRFRAFKDATVVFTFLLVWMSFVNFTMAIPSFGGRFIVLSIPFICYLSLLTFSYIRILPKLIYLIPFIFSYSILYWVRNMITVTDPYLFISIFPHIFLKNLFL